MIIYFFHHVFYLLVHWFRLTAYIQTSHSIFRFVQHWSPNAFHQMKLIASNHFKNRAFLMCISKCLLTKYRQFFFLTKWSVFLLLVSFWRTYLWAWKQYSNEKIFHNMVEVVNLFERSYFVNFQFEMKLYDLTHRIK